MKEFIQLVQKPDNGIFLSEGLQFAAYNIGRGVDLGRKYHRTRRCWWWVYPRNTQFKLTLIY